jgi:hypothetical protein
MQKGRDLMDRGLFCGLGFGGVFEGLVAGKPPPTFDRIPTG